MYMAPELHITVYPLINTVDINHFLLLHISHYHVMVAWSLGDLNMNEKL